MKPVINDIFELAIAHVKKWEGGYVNDKDDPGGATRWGIALNGIGRVLGFRKKDIWNLTWPAAKLIYKKYYWNNVNLQKVAAINPGLALAAFDSATNQGQRTAAKFLQKAVGAYADGAIGPRTLYSIGVMDKNLALRNFMVYRAMHYSSLIKLSKYWRGWFNRLFDTNDVARKLNK